MADKIADDDLDLKPADAGAAFRIEMFLTNALLGYWKHMVAAVVVCLLAILAWGQYGDWYTGTQRAATAQIADALGRLPASVTELPTVVASDPSTDLTKIDAVGDELVAIANGARGASRIEGYLLAAELFRVAGKADKQRTALESAAAEAPGALAYAAESGLANLDLAEGKSDAAIERLKKLSTRETGFLAEQSTIDLAMAYEQLGRTSDASAAYDDFVSRFPDSPRLDQVKQRQAGLTPSAAAPAPAEAPAPAPAEAPADAPPAPAPADGAAPGGAG